MHPLPITTRSLFIQHPSNLPHTPSLSSPPPTKPLQYRFAFTIYLPFELLLHLLLTYGVYADVQIAPNSTAVNTGFFEGFEPARSYGGSPEKCLHSVFCVLMALLIPTHAEAIVQATFQNP